MKKKNLQLADTKKIALVYRPDTTPALTLAKTLTSWLKERDYEVYTAPEQKKIAGTTLMNRRSELSKMAMLVVLGGDGTYLRAVRLLEGKPIPILGVNLGSLGFLTQTRAEELFTAVEQSLENKMELRPRAMIDVTIFHKGKKKSELRALNDVVIERGSFSQLINIAIHAERKLVSEVKADGLIISSPTGSTAYNLSVGGPILHPQSPVVVVTPIAPHSLTSRPLIFPDTIRLSFKLIGKAQTKQKAHFVLDGFKLLEITPEHEIVMTRSENDHLMVLDPKRNFFHLLREKLKFGDRA